MAVHPWHYDAGWHITGTFGVLGGIVGAGKLLGLNTGKMVAAFGIGGTQAAGVREVFGSMTKPMHAGRAAQAGVNAGLLAASGFTSTESILEGRRGYIAVASSESDLTRATDGLGSHWRIAAEQAAIDAVLDFQHDEFEIGLGQRAGLDGAGGMARLQRREQQQCDGEGRGGKADGDAEHDGARSWLQRRYPLIQTRTARAG